MALDPRIDLVSAPKMLTIGMEQATRPSHCWKRLYVVDKTRFVFGNEIKQLITNRDAVRCVGDISRHMHHKCVAEQAWLRQEMQKCAVGPVNPVIIGSWLAIFDQFLARILIVNGNGNVSFYDKNILTPLAILLRSHRKLMVPFTHFPAVGILQSKFNDYFQSHGVRLEADTIFGLSCQLLTFSGMICLDILSQYLELEIDKDYQLHVRSIRPDFLEMWDPSIYDSMPKKDYRFVILNQLPSLKKKMFVRDKYKTSIWHEMLYSEYHKLLEIPFDYHIHHKEMIPQKTAVVLQKYFIRLQMRMRECIESGRLRQIGAQVFLLPGQSLANNDFYYRQAEKQPSMSKLAEFMKLTCREMLNDEQLGVYLFCSAWEAYTLTMCSTDKFLIEYGKFPLVARNLDATTLSTLDIFHESPDMESTAKRAAHQAFIHRSEPTCAFIIAQLLRFVLKFAVHAVRITLKLRVVDGKLTHVKFDGAAEIPPWTRFAELPWRARKLAEI